MAKLTGQTIANSYDQLLIVDDANGITASLQAIEAGDTGGSASSLKISTSKCEVIPASNSTALFEVSQANGTAVLSVDTTNARVGIGTASPDFTLDIEGGTLGGETYVNISNTNQQQFLKLGIKNNIAEIAWDNNDKLQFGILDSSADTTITPYMTMDQYGRVGIGTTSPVSQFQVTSSNTGSAGGGVIRFQNEDSTIVDGDTLGSIYFGGRDASSSYVSNNGAIIRAQASDTWNSGVDAHEVGTELQFFTQDDSTSDTLGAPRMTIDHDGNVGIGETSPTKPLHVKSADIDQAVVYVNHPSSTDGNVLGVHIDFSGADPNNSTQWFMHCEDSTAGRFTLYSDGTMKSLGTYGNDVGGTDRNMEVDNAGNIGYQASTERVKGNIVDMEDISWLYNLRPRNFEYKEFEYAETTDSDGNIETVRTGNRTETLSGIKEYGLIAEEVEEVDGAERLVSYNIDGVTPEAVSYNKLISILLKAVQELSAKVTALENA